MTNFLVCSPGFIARIGKRIQFIAGSSTPPLLHTMVLEESLSCEEAASLAAVAMAKPLRRSYVHGASECQLLFETVGDLLRSASEKVPDREFVIFKRDGVRKTYKEVLNDAEDLASGLLHLGVEKGDRIGIWGPNTYEWVVTQFAAALGGMILVNINPSYQSEELKFAIDKVGIKVLIAPPGFKKSNYYQSAIIPEVVTKSEGRSDISTHAFPTFRHLIIFDREDKSYQGAWRYSDVIKMGNESDRLKLSQIEREIQPDDPCNIQYTSGTTGEPKGATLSHHNITNNAFFVGYRAGYQEQAIDSEGCTALYGTPTMFIDMLNHPDFHKYNMTTIRSGFIAGAPCPITLCQRLVKEMNMHDLQVCYGTTETSPVSFMSIRNDPPEQRIKSVGHIMDHLEAAIIDKFGKMVPRGEKGEVVVRGYSVMRCYWNSEEQTRKEITADRWYHTGDIGVMHENGTVSIVGRSFMGTAFAPVKSDIAGNVRTRWLKDPIGQDTLQKLIASDLKDNGGKLGIATEGLLWLKRGQEFMLLMLIFMVRDYRKDKASTESLVSYSKWPTMADPVVEDQSSSSQDEVLQIKTLTKKQIQVLYRLLILIVDNFGGGRKDLFGCEGGRREGTSTAEGRKEEREGGGWKERGVEECEEKRLEGPMGGEEKKDMIVRGGENIYPTEVENFLDRYQKVADVHIVGVPDERFGEVVCAWIRLKDEYEGRCTEHEIREFCAGKIAHFKVPRYILFKKEKDFPMTATGKVKKFEIREISKIELARRNENQLLLRGNFVVPLRIGAF
uniref:Medium-chain acyl-CoA ligase ACSF2, mitochondrial n=1 Tax=Pristionchus pacificus TaxID=54126 RepID=A0A2A6C0G3_PRIPA|eukprot:PDM71618.1 acs-1 [Pristionchus pacificus]